MENQKYLFRGKRVDNGEWVEGSLVLKKRALPGIMVAIGAELADNFKLAAFIWPATNLPTLSFEVDPETVGQVYATGLPRLPKIAIGDLVKVQGTKRNGVYTTEIVHSRNGGYTLKENNMYLNDDFIIPAVLEIIGNCWDNPELLTTTQPNAQ